MMTLSPVERIRARLGEGVVLVSVARGGKNPTLTGWRKIRAENMADPDYLASLALGGNIGVACGSVSGGLCTIDVDGDAELEAFLGELYT